MYYHCRFNVAFFLKTYLRLTWLTSRFSLILFLQVLSELFDMVVMISCSIGKGEDFWSLELSWGTRTWGNPSFLWNYQWWGHRDLALWCHPQQSSPNLLKDLDFGSAVLLSFDAEKNSRPSWYDKQNWRVYCYFFKIKYVCIWECVHICTYVTACTSRSENKTLELVLLFCGF